MNIVEKLELNEFRGVRKTFQPIPLRRFNVFVGKNNSGKSSILEALSLLPHPLLETPKLLHGSEDWNTRIQVLLNLHGCKRESLVYGYDGVARLNFSVRSRLVSVSIDAKGIVKLLIDNQLEPVKNRLLVNLKIRTDDVVFIPSSGSFIKALEASLCNNWFAVEKVKAHSNVVDVIDQYIDDVYTEVTPRFNELYVRKVLNNGSINYVRIKDLGDGIKKVLLVMMWLETLNPKIILWDDVEAYVHSSLTGRILKWLSERDAQVVVSIHSVDSLLELTKIKSVDTQILILNKSKDDMLNYKLLSIKDLEDLISVCQDPREIVDAVSL